MKAKTTRYGTAPEWLGSEKYVNFAHTISDTDPTVQREDRKIALSGSIIKVNGVCAGLLFDDVDVTDGAAPGALMREGFYVAERLPVAPTPAEIDELATAGVKPRYLD